MLSAPLAIVDVAIASAVGKLAVTTYAALRTGIAGVDEHPIFTDASGEPLCCSALWWLSEGEDFDPDPDHRIRRATETVIRKLIEQWETPSLEAVLISGDTWRPHFWQLEKVLASAMPSGRARVSILTEGNAGGLLALEHLSAYAEQHGSVWGLVVGVDSLIHLPTLAELERLNRIKRSDRPRGLCPGEGAAALLVCDFRTAQRHGIPVLAVVSRLHTARESATIFDDGPSLATGLTTCIRDVVSGRALPCTLDVYCDLNGEPYRAHEWTQASLRTLDVDYELHHPADCIGDTGAASAPILTALAALSLPARLGWSARELALVSCSSDSGLRGAALIEWPAASGIRGRIWS